MKKNIKNILLVLAIICLSMAFISPVNAQVYTTESTPYLVKHNADGSVDIIKYLEWYCTRYLTTLEEYDEKVNDPYYKTMPFLLLRYLNYSYPENWQEIINECKPTIGVQNTIDCYQKLDPNFPNFEDFEIAWKQASDDCFAENEEEKNFVFDFFDDPNKVGFKKVELHTSYMVSLRNDGLFKFKTIAIGGILSDKNPPIVIQNSVNDYIITNSAYYYNHPILLLLINENGEKTPMYVDRKNRSIVYYKDRTEAFFADGKPLMPAGGIIPAPAEVFTAEFDATYIDGVGIKVNKNGKGIGSFKAFSNQPGAKYSKDSVYVENEKVVVKGIIGNGKYKGLKICGEWDVLPPFENISAPKKCD
jgi:hypothetical protein